MKREIKQSAISYGIAVGMAVGGCILVYVINRWSYNAIYALNRIFGLAPLNAPGVLFTLLVLSGIALRVFLAKTRNMKVLNSLDPRIKCCFVVNISLVVMSVILIRIAQKVITVQASPLATLQKEEYCLSGLTGAECQDLKQLQAQQSSIDTLYGILTNYKYVMLLLAAVAAIALVLAILCSIIAVYKAWMTPKLFQQREINARRQVVPAWYTKMTFYSIAFIVLIYIATEVLDSTVINNNDFQGLKVSTTFILGIFGIIESSILLSQVKELYGFVFVDDWHQARKSAAVSMVSRDLRLSHGGILTFLGVAAFFIGMLTEN